MSINQVVLPVNISFKDWVDQLNEDLPDLTVPVYDDQMWWQDWANQFIGINNLADIPVVSDGYLLQESDWRPWGRYVVESLLQGESI